jgi:CRISPR system Cascade subunit CasA
MPPAAPFSPQKPETRNATHSYLGRLVPLARLVWFVDRFSVVFENGPEFPNVPALREPSACVVRRMKKKEEQYELLPLRLGRAVWRDLPAITVTRFTEGCPILRRGDSSDREIFVGGLVTDFKAKIEDSVGSFFTGKLAVPAAMFADEDEARDARNDYRLAIQAADAWSVSVWKALGRYHESLKTDPGLLSGFRTRADADFWSLAELALPDLFELLRSGDYPEEPLDNPYAKSAWHRALREAANRAYRNHAPRANARQLAAFAAGLRALWPKNPAKS